MIKQLRCREGNSFFRSRTHDRNWSTRRTTYSRYNGSSFFVDCSFGSRRRKRESTTHERFEEKQSDYRPALDFVRFLILPLIFYALHIDIRLSLAFDRPLDLHSTSCNFSFRNLRSLLTLKRLYEKTPFVLFICVLSAAHEAVKLMERVKRRSAILSLFPTLHYNSRET